MKQTPELSIYVLAAEQDKFLKALCEMLAPDWSHTVETESPNPIHTFTRSVKKSVTLRLERIDPERLRLAEVPSDKPLSPDECRAVLCEFAVAMQSIRATDQPVSFALRDDVNLHHRMDAKASKRLETFLAYADMATGTGDYYSRDRFQQFVMHLHRTEHQVTAHLIYFWALDREFMPDAALRLALEFTFGIELLPLYDGYLEARSAVPTLP